MLPFNTTFSTKFELQRKINMPGSSRARSTRGQENKAWAVYKKNPSRESWDDLSGDQYIICLKPPSPAGKILDRRQLFFLANHNSLEQTPRTRPNLPNLRWSGPATSASMFSVFLDYILWVCQSLWDSFLYLKKLYWFLYLLLSYFYDHGMFIFRWSSNFVEKVVLKGSKT